MIEHLMVGASKLEQNCVNPLQAKAGVVFPPHYGGEIEIWRSFPPHIPRPWGGNSSFCPPPYFETQGGKLKFFPLIWGGKARRRRKILRILTPEMPEILKENTFPNVKGAQKT